jgi:hypothetical protein
VDLIHIAARVAAGTPLDEMAVKVIQDPDCQEKEVLKDALLESGAIRGSMSNPGTVERTFEEWLRKWSEKKYAHVGKKVQKLLKKEFPQAMSWGPRWQDHGDGVKSMWMIVNARDPQANSEQVMEIVEKVLNENSMSIIRTVGENGSFAVYVSL